MEEDPIPSSTSSSTSKPDQPPPPPPPPPIDRLEDPTASLRAAIEDLTFDEKAAAQQDEDGTDQTEMKQEEAVVVENETLKHEDGGKETVKEIVKDGWSDDDGYNHNNEVDGWNDDVDQPEPEQVQGEGGGGDMHQQQPVQYPLRPGAEDCNFYMRMGTCKFGFTCKFNHPPRTSTSTNNNNDNNQPAKPRMKDREDTSERSMQTECKYYLSAGGCKYGKACRFNHSREKLAVVPILEHNFLGLPIRQGEKDCPFYMRNGACKYGANCRFNHPDPTSGSDSPSVNANGEQAPSWSPSRPLNEGAPFLPVSYSLARGAHSQLSKLNQGPIFTQEKNFRPSPAFGSNIHPMAQSAFSHFQPPSASEDFPERPGQPECTYFIKTGDCKFRSGCKFHHPKDRIVQPSCAMTEKGLPLRPGQSVCTHYSNYGICKFGPKCRYDHPPNIQHMAPSIMTGVDRMQHPSTNVVSPNDTSRLSSLGEGTITL